ENGILLPDEESNSYLKKISASARKWDKRNDKAIALIFQAINRSSNAIAKQVILEASNEITATELLKLLEDRFNLKDIRVIQNELKEFNGLQIAPTENGESFINRIQISAIKLKTLGKVVDE
ncbi:MAG: hypothetical protein ACK559_39665, partial [bacterium]